MYKKSFLNDENAVSHAFVFSLLCAVQCFDYQAVTCMTQFGLWKIA